MEFDKSRVFTSLNADELKPGDKVIVADDLDMLKRCVKDNSPINTIHMIGKEDFTFRFCVKENVIAFALAYLVERAKNCTNCEGCGDYVDLRDDREKVMVCSEYKPNTEMPELISLGNGQYAEKKHTDYNHCEEARKAYDHAMTNACSNKYCRPFKDTDELVKVWFEKDKRGITNDALEMPYIWVRQKECSKGGLLITYFGEDEVKTDVGFMTMSKLLSDYTFLDGSPCGVEE